MPRDPNLLAAAKQRFALRAAQILARRTVQRMAQPAPRYDDVYLEGTATLDQLARTQSWLPTDPEEATDGQ